MYSTPKEVHVGIVSRLNQINSNRNRTFRDEELDMAFNLAMFKFIEERSIVHDSSTGLDETVKRQDDLEDLKVSKREVKIQYRSVGSIPNISVFCVLPEDYYKFEGLQLGLNYACHRTNTEVKTKATTNNIKFLEFPTPSEPLNYDTFSIKKNAADIYKTSEQNIQGIKRLESKFIIINSVLDVLNVNGVEIYWESYCDIYKKNNFIIIDNVSSDTYNLIVGTTSFISSLHTTNYLEFDYYNAANEFDYNVIKPTELVKSNDINEIIENYYMNKNRHNKPLIELTQGVLKINYDPRYVPIFGLLDYIKRPLLLNLKSGTMTDFKSHISEIIDIAATTLALTLSGDAQSLNAISSKNQM